MGLFARTAWAGSRNPCGRCRWWPTDLQGGLGGPAAVACCGAGLYEEVLFRLLLLPRSLAWPESRQRPAAPAAAWSVLLTKPAPSRRSLRRPAGRFVRYLQLHVSRVWRACSSPSSFCCAVSASPPARMRAYDVIVGLL